MKNWNPLPLIFTIVDQLEQTKIYIKIDLWRTYNLVTLKETKKMAIWIRYGHFESNLMPIRLTYAQAIFQHLINDVFGKFLNKFVVYYLDDIFIYSKNIEERKEHVKSILIVFGHLSSNFLCYIGCTMYA